MKQRLLIALLLFPLAFAGSGGSALAQPQAYEVQSLRKLSADEAQVVVLLNQSAAMRDGGRLDEAVTVADQALALARKTRFRDLEATVLLHIGILADQRSMPVQALQALRRSLLLCELEGNLVCQANARMVVAQVQGRTGEADEAGRQREFSRTLAAAAGDRKGLLNADVAQLASHAGTADDKRSRADAVLAQSRAAGSPVDEALALRSQGRDALEAGDLDRAQSLFDEALARSRAAVNVRAEADSLVALVELAMARRRFKEAADLAVRAVAAARTSRDQGTVGNALTRSASVHIFSGDAVAARDTALLALAAYLADGQALGQGLAHATIGDAEWMAGRRTEAEAHFRDAIRLAVTAGDVANEASARLRLASLLRAVDPAAAMAQADRAGALYGRITHKSGTAATLLEQAQIHGAANDMGSAIDKASRGRALYQEIRRPDKVARADFLLSVAYQAKGRPDEAAAAVGRSVAGYRALAMPAEEAEALLYQADMLGRRGDLQAADAGLGRGQEIAARNTVILSRILLGRSVLHEALGRRDSAVAFADQAMVVARSTGRADAVEAARKRQASLGKGER
ncbi:MAG: hypothetical protein JWQ33_499 [Ramlibacter sp.]|nr:hypothetical protein [Ramlibacter sp.]